MSGRPRQWDAVVLGLGGLGSGALYWLARRGARVLGIERFETGHDRGGSQDHSRIIRLSYHRPEYVRLAFAAYEAWEALEQEAGERLVTLTGGLDLFPAGAAIPPDDYVSSLEACGVPFERLTAAQIRRRWPAFTIDDDVIGLFQERGGLVDAARANAAHLRCARARGAEVLSGAPVESLRPVGDDELEIRVGGETHLARAVVVAAGAWSNRILEPLGRPLPLTVTREQVTYFGTPHLDELAPDRFPIWIWMDEPSFYGFPVYGEPGVKVAQDVGGRETTAEERDFEPDPEALERVRSFCSRLLPKALGPELYTKTCLYTLTPDRDFVLDAVPGAGPVWVAIGAGHAFKFASAIGRILAELAVDGRTEADLSLFSIDRPILREADPPKHFMV
ncbi:MAG: N-methyl-L-tryptophan oxidase [Thermoanaerobaculia bacterium]